MADTPKHSVSVAGIVVDDQDRVLVIQRRDNGRWEPPGGVLELDEAPEEGVAREVLEETGVQVAVVRLSGVYKNMRAGVVSLVFLARPVGGAVQQTYESRRVQWMGLVEVKSLMPPAYSSRIEDAFGADVVVRSHDGTDLIDAVAGRY